MPSQDAVGNRAKKPGEGDQKDNPDSGQEAGARGGKDGGGEGKGGGGEEGECGEGQANAAKAARAARAAAASSGGGSSSNSSSAALLAELSALSVEDLVFETAKQQSDIEELKMLDQVDTPLYREAHERLLALNEALGDKAARKSVYGNLYDKQDPPPPLETPDPDPEVLAEARKAAKAALKAKQEAKKEEKKAKADAAREESRERALADPANYKRYLTYAKDLKWWKEEGCARAAEARDREKGAAYPQNAENPWGAPPEWRPPRDVVEEDL